MKNVLVVILALCGVCHIAIAHDDFPANSIDHEHLSSGELSGYLHGHKYKVRSDHLDPTSNWVVSTNFWGYDPDGEIPHSEQTQFNWEESGCLDTDENGNTLYDHDCFNDYIDETGLVVKPINPPTEPIDEVLTKKKHSTEGLTKVHPTEDLTSTESHTTGITDSGTPPNFELGHTGLKIRKLPTLTITHIKVNKRPYILFLYIHNETGRFISVDHWSIAILDSEGEVRRKMKIGRDSFLTPQGINCRRNKDYTYEDGCANNKIGIASPKVIRDWDHQKHRVRIRVDGRIHFAKKSNRYNPKTDSIQLIANDKNRTVIATYSEVEAEVAASPIAPVRKATIQWAKLKQR